MSRKAATGFAQDSANQKSMIRKRISDCYHARRQIWRDASPSRLAWSDS